MAKSPHWIGKVLEHIKHQDKRILFPGVEFVIKGAKVDPVAKGIGGIYELRRGFDSLDSAELLETGEKKSISATYVEDAIPASWWTKGLEGFNNKLGASAPPPVLLK